MASINRNVAEEKWNRMCDQEDAGRSETPCKKRPSLKMDWQSSDEAKFPEVENSITLALLIQVCVNSYRVWTKHNGKLSLNNLNLNLALKRL